MSDWVHCNKCFALPAVSSSSAFYLTNCGHMLCKKCLQLSNALCRKANKSLHCYCCSKAQIKVIAINSTMDDKVKQYFMDSDRMWKQRIAKALKVYQFQSMQMKSLVKFIAQREKENKMLKQKNEELIQRLHQQSIENLSATSLNLRSTNVTTNSINPNDSNPMNISFRSVQSYKSEGLPSRSSIHSSISQRRRPHSAVGGAKPVALDSPIVFSPSSGVSAATSSNPGSASTSFAGASTYRPPIGKLKPTILASYSASSSHNSSSESSLTSAARSILMAGRITKGNVLPLSTSRSLKSSR